MAENQEQNKPQPPQATPSLSGVPEKVTERQGSGAHVLVKHTVVGRYSEGSIVPVAHFGDAENLQRLIDLGALEEYDRANPSMRLPTLSEVNRSDSPPTLPVVAGVDTTGEELRHVMDLRDTFSGNALPDDPNLEKPYAGEPPAETADLQDGGAESQAVTEEHQVRRGRRG